MFDAVVSDISQRFGLGDKTQGLVTSLVGLVFDPDSGGFQGLLHRFKQQGLGEAFSSWLGGASSPPVAIDPQQLERVLGSGTISALADRFDLARGTVSAVATAALPKIIGAVTPDGRLPSGIPSPLEGMLDGRPRAGGFGWAKWVIPVTALALGYCVAQTQPAADAPAAPNLAARPAR